MKILKTVSSSEKINHTGDLLIEGDVEIGAKITVTNGTLTIKGNIHSGSNHLYVEIYLQIVKPAPAGSMSFFQGATITAKNIHFNNFNFQSNASSSSESTSTNTTGNTTSHKLIIEGHTGDYALINSDAEIKAKTIGSGVCLKSRYEGCVATDLGNNTTIVASKGIAVGHIGSHCYLESETGGLVGRNVGIGTKIFTQKGINVGIVDKDVTLESKENKVQRTLSDGIHPPLEHNDSVNNATSASAISRTNTSATTTTKFDSPFLKEKNNENTTSKEDPMWIALRCPLTGTLIDEPVLCLLDFNSYSRTAIEAWLNGHRSSPTTGRAMEANQQVSDVLIPNNTLADAIAAFNKKNAKLSTDGLAERTFECKS